MNVQTVRFGDLVDVVNENEYEPIKNGITKYVAGGHLESETLRITRFGDIEQDKEVIGSAFHRKFLKGDILFGTRRAYLRKTGIATFDGICANTTLVLRKKSSGLVEGLLPFIVRSEKFTEHAVKRSVGSTNPYVRWRDLAEFELELPSIQEQLRIKEILWSIQNSIDNLENLIQKTKIYYISRRESLLTRGIGHTDFKKIKSFFGKYITIPKYWKELCYRDVCEFINGYAYSITEFRESGYPIIRIQNLTGGKNFLYSDIKLPEKQFAEKGDLLFAWSATFGPFIWDGPKASYHYHQWKVMPNKLADKQFLYYHLEKISPLVKQMGQSGLGMFHMTKEAMEKFPIYLPEVEEQQKIGSILTKINKEIFQQQSHLPKLKTIQKSILDSKLNVKEKINVIN